MNTSGLKIVLWLLMGLPVLFVAVLVWRRTVSDIKKSKKAKHNE